MNRTPFQGVLTVVRFNWHLYVFALAGVAILALLASVGSAWIALPALLLTSLLVLTLTVSLLATWLAYDASGLYQLAWLDNWIPAGGRAANIHAGFDETSALLRSRFPALSWNTFDFYDPVRHTEISIRRARRAQPPEPGTQPISTTHLPLADASLDRILLILAAHEIRDSSERAGFFRELHRVLASDGLVIVTEHVRDLPNIAAYNAGAWHFHNTPAWLAAFAEARFEIVTRFSPAPLITTFILKKHGFPA